jgi:hypothetical protein
LRRGDRLSLPRLQLVPRQTALTGSYPSPTACQGESPLPHLGLAHQDLNHFRKRSAGAGTAKVSNWKNAKA